MTEALKAHIMSLAIEAAKNFEFSTDAKKLSDGIETIYLMMIKNISEASRISADS